MVWCSSPVRAVLEIKQAVAVADVDVKLAFLHVAADVAIRGQRMSRHATDDTNAPPARIKDTPARESQ